MRRNINYNPNIQANYNPNKTTGTVPILTPLEIRRIREELRKKALEMEEIIEEIKEAQKITRRDLEFEFTV